MGAVTGQEPYSFNKKAEAIAGDAGLVNQGLDESRAERIGKIGGTAVLGVGAIGSLAKATSLVAPILQGFRAAPKTFAATETIAAGGSAIGGEIGRTYGETEELIGQVVGGITAPFTLSTAAKMPTFRLLRKASKPFTKSGGKDVAGGVAQNAVTDKTLTVNLANDANLLPGEKLTLGGKSGGSRLLSLEKAVAKKLPEVADDMAKNEAETNRVIRNALKTGGDIDNTVMFFEAQKFRVESALRARMAGAVKRANDSISKLKAGTSRAQSSRIISNELEDALKDARIQEKQIWTNLDGTQELGLPATRQVFDEYITKETPIPSFVRDSLKGKKIKVKSFKNVRELRSKILRVQTFARAQGNAEEAFLLQKINEGILEDIASSNLGDDFSAAVTYSRSLNEKFTRGPVGNLMRFSTRGGRAVAPELVSEELLSTTAPKAAQGVRAVRAAVGSNEALEDGILSSVKNKLFKGSGEFDEAAAKKFVESKSELLNEMPGLKGQIVDAANDINARNVLEGRISKAKVGLLDRRRSAAAVVLGANPEKRLVSILNHPKRKQMLAQVVRVAKKDDAAFEGIQDSYNSELFKRAKTSRNDAFGRKMLSGQAMREFFNETKGDLVSSGLYTKEHLKNFNIIINTAERLEKQVLARAGSAEIMASDAGIIEDFILRVVGANIGAKFASGSGAPFVAAQAGSRITRMAVEKLPFDRVTQVLGEAVKDPELMKDLLMRRTSFEAKRAGLKRLNAWVTMLDPSSEEDEP